MKDSPYRKQAIESFHARDEFQKPIRIITPKSWMYLVIFLLLFIAGCIWLVFGSMTTIVKGQGIIFTKNAEIMNVISPVSGGHVSQMLVQPGDNVKKGQLLATLVNPAGSIVSPADGVVTNNYVKVGDYVSEKQTLTNIMTNTGNDLEVIAFFTDDVGKKIAVGMSATVVPTQIDPLEYGGIEGKVNYVSALPVPPTSLENILADPSLVNKFTQNGPVYEVKIALVRSPDTITGYRWTTSAGPDEQITIGTLVDVAIVTKKERPIYVVFDVFRSMTKKVWNKNE